MIAYVAIFGTSLAAYAGAPLWAVIPGTLVLLTLSLIEQRKLSARFTAVGQGHIMTMARWQNAGESLIAVSAAYVLGVITGFFFYPT